MFQMKWVEKGLHFSCGQCGNCCTGSPGYVWMTPEEMKKMAAELAMDFDSFSRRYIRQIGEHYSLIEHANGECVFWQKSVGCQVYDSRPSQCRTYPFWPEIMKEKKNWQKEAKLCLGIRESIEKREGNFHKKHDIEETVKLAKANDPLIN
jgi:Fe-S-cluster containining protein